MVESTSQFTSSSARLRRNITELGRAHLGCIIKDTPNSMTANNYDGSVW